MPKDVPPTDNGDWQRHKLAIEERFKGINKALEVADKATEERFDGIRKGLDKGFKSIDKALSAHDDKHKHHYHSEKEMRALINKARGAWMAIAVVSSGVVALMAYFKN